jgi:hypothetical protein
MGSNMDRYFAFERDIKSVIANCLQKHLPAYLRSRLPIAIVRSSEYAMTIFLPPGIALTPSLRRELSQALRRQVGEVKFALEASA